VGVIGTFLLGLAVALAVAEFHAWAPILAKRALRLAVRVLPLGEREERSEQWSSDLEQIPGNVSKLLFAVDLIRGAVCFRFLAGDYKSLKHRIVDIVLGSASGGASVAADTPADREALRRALALVFFDWHQEWDHLPGDEILEPVFSLSLDEVVDKMAAVLTDPEVRAGALRRTFRFRIDVRLLFSNGRTEERRDLLLAFEDHSARLARAHVDREAYSMLKNEIDGDFGDALDDTVLLEVREVGAS
jgi:hypothetical protein